MECVSCRKKISDDEAYCSFACRKDHSMTCCNVTCLRTFEKRCAKAADSVHRLQQKLNNLGQAPALRRLQAADRDKLKQYLEAEKYGLMVCPVDCTLGTLPICAYVLNQTKASPPDDEKGAEGAPPAPPRNVKEGIVSVELVADEMLEVLKKDDNVVDFEASTKLGKQKKSQKSKKGQLIVLDWKTRPIGAEPAPPPHMSPFSSLNAQNAWSNASEYVVSPGMPRSNFQTPAAGRTPVHLAGMLPLSLEEKTQRVQTLAATTGCSEDKAIDLLDAAGWNLNEAAMAYLEPQSQEPRWGARLEKEKEREKDSKPQAQVQSSAKDAIKRTAPTQPPPPPLPSGWMAVWCEAETAYYFWHKPTNKTTWDAPELDEDCSKILAEEEEEARRSKATAALCNATQMSHTSARELLAGSGWNLERALKAHSQRELDAQARRARHKLEEELALRKKQEEEAARRAQEEARAAAQRAEAEQMRLQRLGERVCIRSWRPQTENCLRIIQGERINITWVSEDEGGWAYGSFVSNAAEAGYVPQAIIAPLTWVPRQRAIGSHVKAKEVFRALDDVTGYLEVENGDVLEILRPLDPPFVWAYAARVSPLDAAPPHEGWVPESVFGETV